MRTKSEFAGKTVTLADDMHDPELDGQEFRVEDWWINVSGESWMFAAGNPACIKYAIRAAAAGLPTDDEVVYGKVGALGHLVHVAELASTGKES